MNTTTKTKANGWPNARLAAVLWPPEDIAHETLIGTSWHGHWWARITWCQSVVLQGSPRRLVRRCPWADLHSDRRRPHYHFLICSGPKKFVVENLHAGKKFRKLHQDRVHQPRNLTSCDRSDFQAWMVIDRSICHRQLMDFDNLHNLVPVVEAHPLNLKWQLVRNGLYDCTCPRPSCVAHPFGKSESLIPGHGQDSVSSRIQD